MVLLSCFKYVRLCYLLKQKLIVVTKYCSHKIYKCLTLINVFISYCCEILRFKKKKKLYSCTLFEVAAIRTNAKKIYSYLYPHTKIRISCELSL